MKFLIPFTKSRNQTGNAESDDEMVESESYSQLSEDSEMFTKEDDGSMHNSEDGQNTQEEQQKSKDTTIQRRQAQSTAVNEVDTQPCSDSASSTVVNATRGFQVPLTTKKLKTKQPSTGSWEHAAVQCLSDLSSKYKRKVNEPPDEEDSDLLFLKSLLPDMKKLNDAQKRRYKQRVLALYDEIISEQYVPVPAYSPALSNYSSVSSPSSYGGHNEINNQATNIHQTESCPTYATLVSAVVNIDNNFE